jgi:zona occludens toxin
MINILIGTPGSGKSYESVAFHLLTELQRGRKVITNLTVYPDKISEFDPSIDISLLVILVPTKEIPRPFSKIDHYSDPWRHPVDGSGPFYIIDECHFSLPRNETPREIEEWFSMHRHESADVLLITQSYGKVSKAVIDIVQICYRVRKNTALGSSSSYVRKVFDGVRGEQVNMSVRRYDKKYFPLYKSNTRGGGKELSPQDVKPIWKNWTFYGVGLCLLLLIYQFSVHGNPLTNLTSPKTKNSSSSSTVHPTIIPKTSVRVNPADPVPIVQNVVASSPPPEKHPYFGYEFKLKGCAVASKRSICVIGLAHNGQSVADITDGEIRDAGYSFKVVNSCLAIVQFNSQKFFAICDQPHVGSAGTLDKVAS